MIALAGISDVGRSGINRSLHAVEIKFDVFAVPRHILFSVRMAGPFGSSIFNAQNSLLYCMLITNDGSFS